MDRAVVGNVVSVVAQGRREKWHQPNRVDAKIFEIVEFLCEALEITNAIAIAVEKCADVDLVNYRALVPGCILSGGQIPSPGVVLPTDLTIVELAVLRCAVTIGLFL